MSDVPGDPLDGFEASGRSAVMEVTGMPSGAGLLADAFSAFISAASRLEGSYAELQGQVAQLGLELAERNAALNASLAENERMRAALQQIVDSMPCGVLVLENDGGLSMINPEGMRLLELAPLQAGEPVAALAQMPGQGQGRSSTQTGMEGPARPAGRSLDAISAHAGIDLSSFVADTTIPDGEQEFCVALACGKRWIEVRKRRLHGREPDEHGASTAPNRGQTILILRDITAHKQAEQERERARRATALAEVAAMLAHEIRNPLTSLELFAGLIAESESLASGNGPELRWISHMRAGIRSLAGTVNNVLSFHGARFPVLAPLSLSEAIESSVEFVRPIAEQAGVALEFAPDAGRSGQAMVLGNESGLQQVVLNLVSNAVRYTAKGGRVRVALGPSEAAAGRIQIEFADSGSGIRPEDLPEIFRAGFSASGNTSGLGLAVCGQIVAQHGGAMRVSSKLGSGTTFYVELPTL